MASTADKHKLSPYYIEEKPIHSSIYLPINSFYAISHRFPWLPKEGPKSEKAR